MPMLKSSLLFEEQFSDSSNRINWVNIQDKFFSIDAWNNRKDRTSFTFIDLFTGAGGLSCGLCMAGFNPIASIEIMPEAVDTYKYNFTAKGFNTNDVKTRDIRNNDVKNDLIFQIKGKHINLIAGGFPCQGFSMAGLREIDDPRNSLYKEMLYIVSQVKPDFVLMENVEGLRTMLNGKIEAKILNDYKNLGYKINVATLNAANYAVPQTRKRVIFIGNRIGKENYYPKPFLNESNYKTVKDAIEKFTTIQENKAINHIFTKHTDKMVDKMRVLKQGQSLYTNFSDAWKRVYWNKPSNTIKENHGGVNVHPLFPRVMTPRELAALQSFPDDFIFKGSKKWQLVQIGNAVPPLLGKVIGLAIRQSMEE